MPLYGNRCLEVTLKDFRSAIGKSSSHKFFFKSQDPDIGQVKEEVCVYNSLLCNFVHDAIQLLSPIRYQTAMP